MSDDYLYGTPNALDGIEERFGELLGLMWRIAEALSPDPPIYAFGNRYPWNPETAASFLACRAADLVSEACSADARAHALARGLLAKKRDMGLRAALAREMREVHLALRKIEDDTEKFLSDARKWRDCDLAALPAPLADVAERVAEFARQTVWLARARVTCASTTDDADLLAALGLVIMGKAPPSRKPPRGNGDGAAKGADPATAAPPPPPPPAPPATERALSAADAALLAELLK
ncbi:MAG: hypothetical protein ACK4PG_07135 [Acetobacteraceae bacterium]